MNDRHLFHRLHLRKGSSSVTSSLLVNGRLLEDVDDVREGWAEYFEGLASPSPDQFDVGSYLSVQREFMDIYSSPPSNDVLLTTSEMIEAALKSLSKGKAAGMDMLSAEHFLLGSRLQLAAVLAPLFTAMVQLHVVPPAFSTSFVIPIPKSRAGPLHDPTRYRGISIASVLTNIFERVLLDNFVEPVQSLLHELHGGFREGLGTGHTSFLLHEALVQARSNRSKCYVAFLDAKKAFDTVWHEGLLVKLHKAGLTGALWHFIAHWYSSLFSVVRWKGCYSWRFKVSQGIRQGALLSPCM